MMYPKLFGKMLIVLMLSMATLIAGGADASVADAAENREMESIRSLIQQNIDVNAPQVDGTTAMHWAAYHDDLWTVKLLLRGGADAKVENRYGVTPLSLALTNGNVAMVEIFLNSGEDPNATLSGGETALMTAARTGKVGAVKALLARGAELESKVRGQTALMWAASDGHVEVVQELINAGADFRAPVPSGYTPLLFAVREGQMDIVKTLLKAGADVNETIQRLDTKMRRGYGGRVPRMGASALLLAVTNGHFELASYLLEAGANPNADEPGFTPLHMVFRIRKTGGGDNNPPPQGSGNVTSLEFVKKLVAHGADVNARMTKRGRLGSTRLNEIGATPFMLASQSADLDLMKTLLELGADPTINNEDNSTPLMVAAGLPTRSPGEDAGTEAEVLQALQLLLDLGADVDAVDNNGETAMHGGAYKNYPKVVAFLAEKGAKMDIWYSKNKNGWTPLSIARGYRVGNFKPSPVTVAELDKLFAAAGRTTPTLEEEGADTYDIYSSRRGPQVPDPLQPGSVKPNAPTSAPQP